MTTKKKNQNITIFNQYVQKGEYSIFSAVIMENIMRHFQKIRNTTIIGFNDPTTCAYQRMKITTTQQHLH